MVMGACSSIKSGDRAELLSSSGSSPKETCDCGKKSTQMNSDDDAFQNYGQMAIKSLSSASLSSANSVSTISQDNETNSSNLKTATTDNNRDDDDKDDTEDDDEDENSEADSEQEKDDLKGAYDSSEFDNLEVSTDIKELFQHISSYTPQTIELETKMKPIIPDYIPAVGDIDTWIKIPRPDSASDGLGLTVLDEPCSRQSDSAALQLQLRSVPTSDILKLITAPPSSSPENPSNTALTPSNLLLTPLNAEQQPISSVNTVSTIPQDNETNSSNIKTATTDKNGDGDDEDDDEDENSEADSEQEKDDLKGVYDPSEFDKLEVSTDIKELFQHIASYTPQTIKLKTKMKPIIPDYIPAVGGIDTWIKIPRPDNASDGLGLTVLDEPCSRQSDPGALQLQLRSVPTSDDILQLITAPRASTRPEQARRPLPSCPTLAPSAPPPTLTTASTVVQPAPPSYTDYVQNPSMFQTPAAAQYLPHLESDV